MIPFYFDDELLTCVTRSPWYRHMWALAEPSISYPGIVRTAVGLPWAAAMESCMCTILGIWVFQENQNGSTCKRLFLVLLGADRLTESRVRLVQGGELE